MAAKLASPKKRPSKKRGILKIATLGVAGLIAGLLAGCSASTESIALTDYSQVVGNWQITPSANTLPAFAGSLTVNGSQVSGTIHPLTTTIGGTITTATIRLRTQTTCAPGTTSFPVTGSIDSNNKMTLTSSNFTGGTLTVTGTLPSSQNALNNATIAITDGSCATPSAQAVIGKYDTISGTYNGTIYSVSGTSLYVSTIFTQTTQPDGNGTYHLQGNSTFGSLQPCLPTPPAISDSTVTGSTLNATYTETPTGGSPITVVVNATFAPDASSLTLNSYQITGGYCDGDSGHGTLTRQ
jgi:hypothetical protein